MSPLERVSPEEACQLLNAGYTLLDVRSQPEFALGHVPGAVNIPLMIPEFDRLRANPDFLDLVQGRFRTDHRLLLSCASGNRSLRAARELVAVGFQNVVDLRTGLEGCRDEFGELEPGWRVKGFPIEVDTND